MPEPLPDREPEEEMVCSRGSSKAPELGATRLEFGRSGQDRQMSLRPFTITTTGRRNPLRPRRRGRNNATLYNRRLSHEND
jgi:hypothetical protein